MQAALDENIYPTGTRISDQQMTAEAKHVIRHAFHGDWNYDIRPVADFDETLKSNATRPTSRK